jgi:hypothetical protein
MRRRWCASCRPRAAREFDHLDLSGFRRLAAGLRDIQRRQLR